MTALEAGVTRVCNVDVRWWARGSGGPPLLLLHGGGAHAGWWEPLWPHLPARRRVVAVDLSGHGDSGRRASYPMSMWADELLAVIADATDGAAVIVAHSMGGRVAPLAAARDPDAVGGLVILDSAVPLPADFALPHVGPPKVYPTRDRALDAFRLMPAQPSPGLETIRRLALRSVAAVDGGWSWKFDAAVFERLAAPDAEQRLGEVRCPVVLVHGARSDVTSPAMAQAFAAALGRPAPLVTIPGAHHHLQLDAPAALADTLAWLPETREEVPRTVRTPGAGRDSRR